MGVCHYNLLENQPGSVSVPRQHSHRPQQQPERIGDARTQAQRARKQALRAQEKR